MRMVQSTRFAYNIKPRHKTSAWSLHRHVIQKRSCITVSHGTFQELDLATQQDLTADVSLMASRWKNCWASLSIKAQNTMCHAERRSWYAERSNFRKVWDRVTFESMVSPAMCANGTFETLDQFLMSYNLMKTTLQGVLDCPASILFGHQAASVSVFCQDPLLGR